MPNFADRLKECRKNSNKIQRDVAIELGMSESGYQKYEICKREPTLEMLNKLADYFQVSTDYLLGRSDDPKQH